MENQTRKHGAISEQENALTVRYTRAEERFSSGASRRTGSRTQTGKKPGEPRRTWKPRAESVVRGQRGPKRKTPHGALTAGFYSLCSCLSPEHHRSSEMQEQGIKSSLYSTVSPGLEHCLAVRELNQCDLLKEAVHHDWGRWGAPQEVRVAVEETPFVGA